MWQTGSLRQIKECLFYGDIPLSADNLKERSSGMNKKENVLRRLFWVVLILFSLQVVLLPVFLSVTYASGSQKPEHIISYQSGNLEWDDSADVFDDGTAKLNLFDTVYNNVKSSDGEKVIAPGTDKDNIIRLVNKGKSKISYTAVLYSFKTDNSLAAFATFDGNGFSDTDEYLLPKNVSDENVIRAVKGEVGAGQMQEFDIGWSWRFEDDDIAAGDSIDTLLGNLAAQGNADEFGIGFYIVVNDNGTTVTPKPPDTSDSFSLLIYMGFMAVSGIALVLLIAVRKKERK